MKLSCALTFILAGGVVLTAASAPSLQAQGQNPAQGQPEVLAAVRHDTSRPLRDLQATPPTNPREDYDVKRTSSAVEPVLADQAVQRFYTSAMAATPGLAFDGVGEGNPNFVYNVNVAPPDTTGDVGLTQYVQWVNSSFAVFDKATGNVLLGPVLGNTLWAGFGGGCQTTNHGDPIVQYDQLADRWVMTQFVILVGAYRQCVAVSQTSDATGAWHRYEFSYSEFPDYPKLAVWPDAYYITFNMFGATGSSFTGGRVCAYDRTQMLSGLAATQVCFQSTAYPSPLPSDLEGQTLPPAGTPNYVLSRNVSPNLQLWKFHVDFAVPANSTFIGPTNIPVAAYTAGSGGVPQPGTAQTLDKIGDRLMYRLGYRNLGSREALTVNHSVNNAGTTAVRWYELDITGGVPTVRQQATYAPDALHRWMGSIATDMVGNIALGYTTSSAAVQPAVRFTGREVADPLNTMGVESSMQVGGGSQTAGLSRWGDYSTMTLDPVDDCTFWYTSEFLKLNGTFNWSTRVGSFKFASCDNPPVGDFTISATPARKRVPKGGSTTFAVTVTPSGGFSETVTFSTTGCPANTTCTYAPPSVNGGGGSTLTIQTTASTPSGSFTIGVVGTSPSLMRSTSVLLVVQ